MERTIRLDLNDQRARANLADFGAEVDALITALSRVDVDLVIEDSTLRTVQKRIDSLSTVVDIDLAVDTGQLDIAIDDVADLNGTVVDVGVDVATADLDAAANQVADLSTTADVDVRVDTSDLDFALDLVADLNDNISSNLNVNTAELDAAVREANSFPDPIETEIAVDDSALSDAAGLAAGGLFGTAVGVGFSGALDLGQTTDLITAQLGLSTDAAEQAGQIAADVYAGAWGDSVGEVGEALTAVGQNLVDLNTAGAAEIENLTIKSLDLATALGEDVGGVTKTVGQLIRTGLVEDASEGFDVLAAGLQEGANRGEDLLDTFNEYSTSFSQLGLDAGDALTILNQGLEGGADNTDRVADSLREFRIRALDGTFDAVEGFEQLGVSADRVGENIAAGGDLAKDAFQSVVFALQGVEDPLERQRLAFELFGSQVEDFGIDAGEAFALYEGDIVSAGGAAEQLGKDLNDNVATQIEEFRRTALQNLTDFVGNTLIPILEDVGPKLLGGLQTVSEFVSTVLIPLLSTGFSFLGEQLSLFTEALQTGTTDGSFLQNVAVFIVNDLIPAIGELRDSFVSDVLPQIVDFVEDTLLPALSDIGDLIVDDVLPALVQFVDIFVDDVLPVLVEVAGFIASIIIPAFVGFAEILIGDVVPVVLEGVEIFFEFLDVLSELELLIPVLVGVIAVLAGPFGLVAGVIIGLVVLVIELYQRFEIVQTIVDGVIGVIQFLVETLITLGEILFDVGDFIVRFLIDHFSSLEPVIEVIITVFGALIDILLEVVGTIAERLDGIPDLISDILSTVGDLWSEFWDGLGAIATEAIDIAKDAIDRALGGLETILSEVIDGLTAVWDAYWDGFGSTAFESISVAVAQIRRGLGTIGGIFSSVLNSVAGLVINSWGIITRIFTSSIGVIVDIVRRGFTQVRQFIRLDQAIGLIRSALGVIGALFSRVFDGLQRIASNAFNGVRSVISAALSGILRRVVTVMGAVARFWSAIWGTITGVVRSVAITISGFMNVIFNAIQRILQPILDALNLIGLLGGAVASLPSPGDLIPGLPSLPSPGGIINSAGGIIGGVLGGIGNLFGDGGVVDRPTLGLIGERGGREAIVPEYASMASIKAILGKTNILDRLAQDFSAQQRSVFAGFNERAATDASLTGPGPGEMIVDRSTHQYDLKIVDGTGTMASKQRTASTVVSELKRRRKPTARPGPGSWRSHR